MFLSVDPRYCLTFVLFSELPKSVIILTIQTLNYKSWSPRVREHFSLVILEQVKCSWLN